MANAGRIGLRVVLLLAGASILITGINVAFGGIRTLGWQGERMFFDITNQTAFRAQDSHVRFLGGLWLGVGLFFVIVGGVMAFLLSWIGTRTGPASADEMAIK